MIRRAHHKATSHDRWLVSYADFITLLFAFFVVLYASAQVDKQKVGALAVAIRIAFQELGAFPQQEAPSVPLDAPPVAAAIPAIVPASTRNSHDMARLQKELQRVLAKEIEHNQVSIRNTPDALVISLHELAFYDSGSAEMRADARSAFARIVAVLRDRSHSIRIEGHTDNVPIHTSRFASNWELSTARATEVVRSMITQYRFAPDRLSAAGYGEFHPVANNTTPDGRATNRRLDLVVIAEVRRP